jgi:hypothetical protein
MTVWVCPFSTDEIALLQKFRGVCESIKSCRFMRDLPKQQRTFTIENLPDGSCRSTYPKYDTDDFLAFLTHFRKLVADKEPTNIFKILKLVARYATQDEQGVLKKIRKQLEAEADSPPLQLAIGPPGQETRYSPKQIEKVIFNGQVFHTDDELQADLRRILDYEPLVKMAFLRYATIVVDDAWRTSCVLKHRGYIQ